MQYADPFRQPRKLDVRSVWTGVPQDDTPYQDFDVMAGSRQYCLPKNLSVFTPPTSRRCPQKPYVRTPPRGGRARRGSEFWAKYKGCRLEYANGSQGHAGRLALIRNHGVSFTAALLP